METIEPINFETEHRPRRSWLFSGRPPSNCTVAGIALVVGALNSWWSQSEMQLETPDLWRESPALALILGGAMAVLISGSLYLMLRLFLPQCKPRVTKRWRSLPLVLRTVSLAQSVIMFQTLQALPVILIGYALGLVLTAAAAFVGLNRTAPPGGLLILAAGMLAASLITARAIRDAERSNYKPLITVTW